tara:strand:- start:310 stop:480 length:171 start_codon:yes stop_codon:yes gene_type:complete
LKEKTIGRKNINMKNKKAKAKIKKVIKGLKGAVKAHTGQHKMLASTLKGNGKKKRS